jgi:hypothetical protein
MYLTYYVDLVGIKRRNCKNSQSGKLQKKKKTVIDSRIPEKAGNFSTTFATANFTSTLTRTVSSIIRHRVGT